jgi:hypothetical protein
MMQSMQTVILSGIAHFAPLVPSVPGENFPYGFKGAQARRNPGRQLALDQRHAKLRWLERGATPAWHAPRLTRGRSWPGHLVPLLGPPGHGGVGALQAPVPAVQLGVATCPRNRAPRKGCYPPGDPALNRAKSPSRARFARRTRWRKRHS